MLSTFRSSMILSFSAGKLTHGMSNFMLTFLSFLSHQWIKY